jgi:prefoldin subunit 5
MATTVRDQIEELRAELADLAEQVDELKRTAGMIRTLAEMRGEYETTPARRPRHLRVIGDGTA